MPYLNVHVTPKAGKNAICGVETTDAGIELKVKVCDPPEDGKATKSVCKVVADALGVAKSYVRVVSGETSRHKRLEVDCSQERIDALYSSFVK